MHDVRTRASVAVAVIALLGGCNDKPPRPPTEMERLEAGGLSEGDVQRVQSTLPGMTEACVAKLRSEGLKGMPDRVEDCFAMTPVRRWRGLWRAEFEGSQFCSEPARECGSHTAGDDIYLTFREGMPQSKLQGRGGLYAMIFDGRRTAHRGFHGHMGMADHELIVDRVIQMTELEPAARDMTPEELANAKKECEASPSCFTNAELQRLQKR